MPTYTIIATDTGGTHISKSNNPQTKLLCLKNIQFPKAYMFEGDAHPIPAAIITPSF
jgi:hypothetical protein